MNAAAMRRALSVSEQAFADRDLYVFENADGSGVMSCRLGSGIIEAFTQSQVNRLLGGLGSIPRGVDDLEALTWVRRCMRPRRQRPLRRPPSGIVGIRMGETMATANPLAVTRLATIPEDVADIDPPIERQDVWECAVMGHWNRYHDSR